LKNDQIQTLNYCAHAIEDLRGVECILRDAAPESGRVFRRLIDMLQHSVKFILPNCCNLIDPEDLRQAHLDLTRLPFPCVAFEAPWEKEDCIELLGEFRQSPATKRIALCWEARPEYELLPGLNSVLNVFSEGGFFVVPIYWGPEHRQWTVALGGSFVPYENTVQEMAMDESLPASRIASAAAIKAGLVKSNAKHFRAEPFYLLPEFYEQALATYGGSREKNVRTNHSRLTRRGSDRRSSVQRHQLCQRYNSRYPRFSRTKQETQGESQATFFLLQGITVVRRTARSREKRHRRRT